MPESQDGSLEGAALPPSHDQQLGGGQLLAAGAVTTPSADHGGAAAMASLIEPTFPPESRLRSPKGPDAQ